MTNSGLNYRDSYYQTRSRGRWAQGKCPSSAMSLEPSSKNLLPSSLYHISLTASAWLPHSKHHFITQQHPKQYSQKKKAEKKSFFSFIFSYLSGRKTSLLEASNSLIFTAHWPKLGHQRLSSKKGELELTYHNPLLSTFPDSLGQTYSKKRL